MNKENDFGESVIKTGVYTMYDALKENEVFIRMENAESEKERIKIALEIESLALDVIDRYLFSEEETHYYFGMQGLIERDSLIRSILEYHYEYFGLLSPFDYGMTVEQLVERNRI